MASNKNKGYNTKMNVLWGIYNATLLGVDEFTEKKKKIAFWWITCSRTANTGSVKMIIQYVQIYTRNISTTYMKRMSLLSCAFVIWGIFRSIVLSFFFLHSSLTIFLSFHKTASCLEWNGWSVKSLFPVIWAASKSLSCGAHRWRKRKGGLECRLTGNQLN